MNTTKELLSELKNELKTINITDTERKNLNKLIKKIKKSVTLNHDINIQNNIIPYMGDVILREFPDKKFTNTTIEVNEYMAHVSCYFSGVNLMLRDLQFYYKGVLVYDCDDDDITKVEKDYRKSATEIWKLENEKERIF